MRTLKVIGLLLPILAIGAVAWADSPPPDDYVGYAPTGDPMITGSWSSTWSLIAPFVSGNSGLRDPITQVQVQMVPLPWSTTTSSGVSKWDSPAAISGRIGWNQAAGKYVAAPFQASVGYNPTGSSLNLTSWSQVYRSDTIAVASGPAWNTTADPYLNFSLSFSPPSSSAGDIYLQLQAYDGNTELVNQDFWFYSGSPLSVDPLGWNPQVTPVAYSWYTRSDGGTWSATGAAGPSTDLKNGTWNADTPIPEPVTLFGVLAGIIGLGRYARKHKAAMFGWSK